MELKRPTTFSTQVQLLEEKNITIGNLDACKDFLSRVNYYRFTAYFLPFFDRKLGKCFNGISFERIQQIYYFDQELRALILAVIEDIEIQLRTQIAYYHSHTYGPDGYYSAQNFNSKHNHDVFMQHILSCIQENDKTLVVKHHKQKYDGKFPLWVIIEFFSMGMLSHFYRSLITSDKKKIAKELYNTSPDNLQSWLRCLTDLRNKCAHYSRIYYWIFPALPKMPKAETYVPTRRLFAQLYMLKLMYPISEKWNIEFLLSLENLIEKYQPYISLKHLDFPQNWKSMLTKEISTVG